MVYVYTLDFLKIQNIIIKWTFKPNYFHMDPATFLSQHKK